MNLKNKLNNYKGLTLSRDEMLNQRIEMKKDVKDSILEFEEKIRDEFRKGEINAMSDLTDTIEDILGDFK